jgi:membrane-associated phospholipid phosphatase
MATHPDARVMRALRPLREKWKFPLYELGSGQYLLPLSGVAYIAGRLSHNAELRDAGMGCITGHLSSAVLRDVIYFSVARVRPHESPSAYRISFPGTHDWMRHSFLSGHTANSMACASFFGHRYSLGAIEPLSYAYVTAIGLGRVADGWHWPSDTMAGAIMGFAIGKFVADRQRGWVEVGSRLFGWSSAARLVVGFLFSLCWLCWRWWPQRTQRTALGMSPAQRAGIPLARTSGCSAHRDFPRQFPKTFPARC